MQDDATTRALISSAVRETLIGLGFDMHSPNELQADMHYLRHLRKGSEDVRKIVRHSLLSILISSALFLLWQALKGELFN